MSLGYTFCQGTDYRDQIVTISVEIEVTQCDVGVSLHSKTHKWHMCVLSYMYIPVLNNPYS